VRGSAGESGDLGICSTAAATDVAGWRGAGGVDVAGIFSIAD
jgi:hypothetical protein